MKRLQKKYRKSKKEIKGLLGEEYIKHKLILELLRKDLEEAEIFRCLAQNIRLQKTKLGL